MLQLLPSGLKQTQQSGWKAVHKFVISAPSFNNRTCIHRLKVPFTSNALEPLRNLWRQGLVSLNALLPPLSKP
jgi:hypothetical protein